MNFILMYRVDNAVEKQLKFILYEEDEDGDDDNVEKRNTHLHSQMFHEFQDRLNLNGHNESNNAP